MSVNNDKKTSDSIGDINKTSNQNDVKPRECSLSKYAIHCIAVNQIDFE